MSLQMSLNVIVVNDVVIVVVEIVVDVVAGAVFSVVGGVYMVVHVTDIFLCCCRCHWCCR